MYAITLTLGQMSDGKWVVVASTTRGDQVRLSEPQETPEAAMQALVGVQVGDTPSTVTET